MSYWRYLFSSLWGRVSDGDLGFRWGGLKLRQVVSVCGASLWGGSRGGNVILVFLRFFIRFRFDCNTNFIAHSYNYGISSKTDCQNISKSKQYHSSHALSSKSPQTFSYILQGSTYSISRKYIYFEDIHLYVSAFVWNLIPSQNATKFKDYKVMDVN